MGRKKLEDEDVAAFREQLCEAAIVLIAEDGFEGLSMRRLAAELGCAHTTPYRYFDSKEAIFLAVRARCMDRFAAHQEAAAARGRTPEARIRAIGRGYVAYARKHPAAFRISFQLDQAPAPDHKALQAATRRAWSVLQGTVGGALESGLIVGDLDQITHLFWSAMHGIASLHLAGRLQPGQSPGALVGPMLDALLDAHRPGER